MDNTTLIILGVAVALVLLYVVRRLMSGGTEEETGAVAPMPSASAPVQADGGVDPTTLALITAAAYAVVGRPVQVRRITFLNQNTVSAWAEVGRISIQSSHNVRRSL